MPKAPKVIAAARKHAVAANMAAGKPQKPADLAGKIGVAPARVSELQRDPDTRAIAERMLEPHRTRLAKLIPRAITVIERGLEAKLPDGKVDHLMRLRAVDRLRSMVELIEDYDFRASEIAASPTGGAVSEDGGVLRGTLQDILLIYRRLSFEAGSTGR